MSPKLDDELWLARRLADRFSTDIFEGLTTPDIRKARMRDYIVKRGLESYIAGKRGGQQLNVAQAFERLWGEPL